MKYQIKNHWTAAVIMAGVVYKWLQEFGKARGKEEKMK